MVRSATWVMLLVSALMFPAIPASASGPSRWQYGSAGGAQASAWAKAIEVPGSGAVNKGGRAEIISVSCPSAGNCGAGGFYSSATDRTQAFVVSEKGRTWGKAIEVPGSGALNKGHEAQIVSVSCASAGNCSAGGFYRTENFKSEAFVVSEKGGTWGEAIEVPGSGALNTQGFAAIDSVSCTSAGNCTAGGYFANGPAGPTSRPTLAMVVRQTRGKWGRAIKVPGLATRKASSQISSVACTSAGNCVAVGGPTVDLGRGPESGPAFVVADNNGVWRKAFLLPGAAAFHAFVSEITSVSCTSAGNCSAGGYYDTEAGQQAFVVSEEKGRWGDAREVPGLGTLNTGGGAQVNSVSCGSAGNCSAGGFYSTDTGQPAFLVSEKNGRWGSAIEIPGLKKLNTGGFAQVSSLSCTSPGTCSAAGYYSSTSSAQAFVVAETNGTWDNVIKVPGSGTLNVGGGAQITSVSCASPDSCGAGGYYTDHSRHQQAFVVSKG